MSRRRPRPRSMMQSPHGSTKAVVPKSYGELAVNQATARLAAAPAAGSRDARGRQARLMAVTRSAEGVRGTPMVTGEVLRSKMATPAWSRWVRRVGCHVKDV